jgi:hypothetical protein
MTQTENADSVPLSEWQPTVSGEAELRLSTVSAGSVTALKMQFDFKGGKGFVVARHAFKRAMPGEYAVKFRLRGRGAINNLELKLIDESGLNVWRYVQKDLHAPGRWRRFKVESREIDFAWGPSSGRGISQLGFIELAIVAGEGGTGTLWIAELGIEDLTPAQPLTAVASSAQAGFDANAALSSVGWKPQADDRKPWLAIDAAQPRSFGGLIIDWLGGAPAGGFKVRASMSGRRWKTVYSAEHAGGKRSYVYLPNLRTRFLRLALGEPSAGASVRPQSYEFSRSIEAFWYTIAAAEARGWHPRWLHREQSEWTPIGTAHGTECALINADGMVEVGQGSFSIEPMLWSKGRLVTWSDVVPRQALKDGWMPVPSVIWESADWRLAVSAEASTSGELRVRYRFENRTSAPMGVRLFVLVRPFQVTPPWQSFRNLGGVSRVHDLVWRDGALRVNDSTRLVPSSEPTGVAAMSFDDGILASKLASGTLPSISEAHDPFGFAAGVLEFELALQAQDSCERAVSCRAVGANHSTDEPAFDWGATLQMSARPHAWSANDWGMEAIRAALTATAHILVTRSGPALQPGPRRYTRSWIRDGAMMSAALLRMGRIEEVAEFIRWYAPNQRADGFVPCCVDKEGVDWLVEHDSHGELLALIADHYRFARDQDFLKESWIFVRRAVQCIEHLLGDDGLMPISVSHEGYLAQPVHAYWDDFWALRGVRDAAELARALGDEPQAEAWAKLATRLAASLFASIEDTRTRRKLDYIPGSIEWADFDPTATANAIYLFDVPEGLDRKAVESTFDKYLADWRAKRAGTTEAVNYTPYEIRIIGALVRLGWRDAALELLRFFLSDRRPQAWNQWPEIAWRDEKTPAHLGDLPHTWISAEYVLALRSLFAYERETDRSLILAAGLAPEWIEGAGVEVDAMPTLYGRLSYSLRRLDSNSLRFTVASGIDAQIILRPPCKPRSVIVDGEPVTSIEGDSVAILRTPAELTFIL